MSTGKTAQEAVAAASKAAQISGYKVLITACDTMETMLTTTEIHRPTKWILGESEQMARH